MNKHSFNRIKKRLVFRVLPFILAFFMLLTSAPVAVFSTDEKAGESAAAGDVIYDYDTLKITLDGEDISSMSIYPYEKIEISGTGVPENATYQWQIKHPEKNNLWVDIYDAKSDTIGVSAALINNMLTEDGTAALRLRAYTDDYAYLSNPVTVTLLEEAQPQQTLSVENITFPHAMAGASDEYVAVTIEYVQYDFKRDAYGNLEKDGEGNLILDDGKQAFSAYVATLVNGNPLKTTVIFPTIVGYDAFWEAETTSSISHTFNEDSVTQNYVYKVSYKPKLVNYSIRYYLQNIYDDQYTEKASETGLKGYTGAEPEDSVLNRNFDGFTSLYHEPDAIAADGSTVFEVYYERNYYLMEFDCAGGYGTETLYVRYETYVAVPDPVRPGWSFDGWDLVKTDDPANTEPLGTPVLDVHGNATDFYTGDGAVNTLPATLPNFNTAYKALWSHAATTFTVIYWVQNANDDGYSYVASYEKINGRTGDVVSITNATGVKNISEYSYYENGVEKKFSTNCPDASLKDFVTLNTVKTADVTLEGDGSSNFNIYFDRKQYTLKFYYAMSSGSGNSTQYYIIGGSTYAFGASASSNTGDEIKLLDAYMNDNGNRGTVDEFPTMQTDKYGTAAQRLTQYDESGTYKYYYIYFTAKYGQNISEWWPCNVFNSVTTTNRSDLQEEAWSGDEAFVSAWNGEHHVYYSQNNSNQTIKGKYELLDTNLLWTKAYGYADTTYNDIDKDGEKDNTAGTVAFLCFWENGADLGKEKPDNNASEIWNIPKLFRYNIYLECAEGVDYAETITHNGVKYYLSDSYDTCDDSNVASQTQVGLTGYIKNGYTDVTLTGTTDSELLKKTQEYFDESLYKEGYAVNFYYTMDRTKYLTLDNYGENCYNAIQPYSTPIQSIIEDTGTPDYPGTLEPGAYEFVGWYTGPKGTGFKIVFDNTKNTDEKDIANNIWYNPTMPSDSFILFAFWKPVIRNVYFYYDYSDYVANKYWYPDGVSDAQKPTYYPIRVPHGSLVGTAYSNIPTADVGYTFVGWFYIDETGKKRFAPDSMEVKRDLHLFAEWQTAIDTTYEINYVLGADVAADNTVTGTQAYPKGTVISDQITAHATVGQTKTFEAMAGSNLYTDFQKKFFPTINSHSILMDKVPANNTYTFEYMYDDRVLYKIQYLEQGTNKELHPAETFSSEEAIISKKFKPIEEYLPTSYYITRTLQYDANATEPIEANVFTFYYVKDTKHALYSIEYYWENADSTDSGNLSNYTLRESIIGTGDLNTNIDIEIKDDRYTGFGFEHCTVVNYEQTGDNWYPIYTDYDTIPATGKITGEITLHGLEIKIYYKRDLMPYTIQYVEYGGGVLDTQTFSVNETSQLYKFGTTVTYAAPATHIHDGLTYYFYATADKPQTQSFEIRAEAAENVITFYYKLKQYTINYVAVCPIPGAVDFGIVSPNMNIGERTTDITGSEAQALSGYKFIGWRDDAGTLVSINALWSPGSYDRDASDKNPGDGIITYYAYFMPVSSSLLIEKTVYAKDGTTIIDPDDTFLFHIKGTGKFEYVDMVVSIQGSGSVTVNEIPQGTYTITELTDWSWKYDCTSDIKTLTIGSEQAIAEFANTANDKNWLNGEAVNENQFN